MPDLFAQGFPAVEVVAGLGVLCGLLRLFVILGGLWGRD